MAKSRPTDFGVCLRSLYEKRGYNATTFSEEVLGTTLPYLRGVEIGKDKPFTDELMERVVAKLKLSGIESETLKDLALKYRNPQAWKIKHAPEIPGKIRLKQAEAIGEGERIPVVSYVSAGETAIAYGDSGYPVGQGMDYIARPEGIKDPHAYGLIIRGNSMAPILPNGTLVVAVTNIQAKQGDVVICRERKEGKVYIKLLKRLDDVVVLESTNPQAHDPLIFKTEDVLLLHKVLWVKMP